jgi:hypothetical protein
LTPPATNYPVHKSRGLNQSWKTMSPEFMPLPLAKVKNRSWKTKLIIIKEKKVMNLFGNRISAHPMRNCRMH